MMKTQNKKRGFTIIELVIVVTVIAILSAVLIPTFAGVIKRANKSADEQAVATINKVLAAEAADEPETIAEFITMMAENGYDVEDYKPLTKDTYFFWVKSENAVVIADASNAVLYPEQYTDLAYKMGDWYTLTGEIEEDDDWKATVEAGKAEVKTGAQFVSLMNSIKEDKKASKDVTTITISQDIDVQGSTINFGTVDQALTIEGNNKTIYGLRNDSNNTVGSGEYSDKGYGYGLIPQVKSKVVVKDIVIDNMIVEDTALSDTGLLGFIAGSVEAGGDLTIENVTIKNSTISGGQRVGALVGTVQGGGKLTVKDVTVTDNTIKGNLDVAVLLGTLVKGSITFEGTNTITGNVVTKNDNWAKTYTAVDTITLLDGETNTLSEGDTYAVSDTTKSVANSMEWEMGCTTQNYYWYNGSAFTFAQRNAQNAYDGCVFSANDSRTIG